MKKFNILVVVILVLSSCSLINRQVTQVPVKVSDEELTEMLKSSVNDMLNKAWLSEFMAEKNERPVVMMSQFENPTDVVFDKELAYQLIDANLIRSGQVRVVKPNATQRNTNPVELSGGESVDYALSASFVNFKNDNKLYFQLMIWNDASLMPLEVIKIEIPDKQGNGNI